MTKNHTSAIRLVLGVFGGNTLEFFDATLMGFLLPHIHYVFFPTDGGGESSLSYVLFSAAYISRPLGAYFWGWVADKYHLSRALRGSVLMMAMATLAIGLIPSHESIGIFSAFLLGVCRFVQGLSVGGEYGTASTYLYEKYKHTHLNTHINFLNASNFMGAVLACVVSFFIVTMASWYPGGWRLAFVFSGLLGFSFFILRQQVDVARPTMRNRHQDIDILSSGVLFRKFLRCACIGGLSAAPYMLFNIYLTNELIACFGIETNVKILINMLICVGYMVLYPLFGILADARGHLFNMRVGSIFLCICGGVGVSIFPDAPLRTVVGLQLAVNLCAILYSSGINTYVMDDFPEKYRCRGVTTSLTLGAALMGSAMIPIVNSFRETGVHLQMMCSYLVFMSLIVLWIIGVPRRGESSVRKEGSLYTKNVHIQKAS
ncbi:MAG: MFS transporter [Alphaproteobacteria bacterium]|nr:MAG: MFS transporter [Alphaproteobacteria bacterium]